jgi:hypothetical protein
MFRGAEAVFRNILVPLTGQYENILLRDTLLVRRGDTENNMKPFLIKSVRVKAAELFLNDYSKKICNVLNMNGIGMYAGIALLMVISHDELQY